MHFKNHLLQFILLPYLPLGIICCQVSVRFDFSVRVSVKKCQKQYLLSGQMLRQYYADIRAVTFLCSNASIVVDLGKK